MKLLIALILFLTVPTWANNSPVVLNKKVVRGKSINLVTINLNSQDVEIRPILASDRSTESFKSLLDKGGSAYTAITGTFFDPASGITVGNVVHNGRLLTEGSVGSVLAIGEDGRAGVRSLEGKMGRHIDWAGTKFAVSAGPTLLRNGGLTISPRSEGFRDKGLYGPRIRAAMGVTKHNKLLLLTTKSPVGLHELARIFRDLGAVDAVNLDGGSSTALYHAGDIVTRPRRRLTNLIAVYAKGSAPDQSKALSNQYARAFKHYNKGLRFFREGDMRLAHSQVRKALSMAPDRAVYWETLAVIQEHSNDPNEAAESYAKAAQLYLDRSQTKEASDCAHWAFDLQPSLREQYPELSELR